VSLSLDAEEHLEDVGAASLAQETVEQAQVHVVPAVAVGIERRLLEPAELPQRGHAHSSSSSSFFLLLLPLAPPPVQGHVLAVADHDPLPVQRLDPVVHRKLHVTMETGGGGGGGEVVDDVALAVVLHPLQGRQHTHIPSAALLQVVHQEELGSGGGRRSRMRSSRMRSRSSRMRRSRSRMRRSRSRMRTRMRSRRSSRRIRVPAPLHGPPQLGQRLLVAPSCSHIRKGIDKGFMKRPSENVDWNACQACHEETTEPREPTEDPPDPPAVWMCLKCGHRGCGRLSESQHALKHYETPRSDPHCLVLSMDAWVVWCYVCDDEVHYSTTGQLAQLVSNIKKQALSDPERKSPQRKAKVEASSEKEVQVQVKEENKENLKRSVKESAGKPSKSSPAAVSVRGLSNLGNTCFFNAVIQNLSQTQLLRQAPMEVRLEEPGSLTLAMSQLLNQIQQSQKGVVTPRELFTQVSKKAARFKGFQQQDSQELLRYLLDGMRAEETKRVITGISETLKHSGKSVDEDESKSTVKEYEKSGLPKNFVDQVFGGELTSTVSLVTEMFLDLSLPVADEECSVQSSLFHFTEVEHLTHNNSLFCVGYSVCKVNRHVQFPQVLDLAPYCTATCKGIPEGQSQVLYSLYGIVEHSGTMRSGHYTAYVKARPACPASSNGLPAQAEPARGSWFHASDSSVQPVTESKAQASQAYLLFYERIREEEEEERRVSPVVLDDDDGGGGSEDGGGLTGAGSKYQQKKAKKQAKKQAKNQRRQQKLEGKPTLDSLVGPCSPDAVDGPGGPDAVDGPSGPGGPEEPSSRTAETNGEGGALEDVTVNGETAVITSQETQNGEEQQEVAPTDQEVVAADQEVDATKQEVDATNHEMDATNHEIDATNPEVVAAKQEVSPAEQEVNPKEESVADGNCCAALAENGAPEEDSKMSDSADIEEEELAAGMESMSLNTAFVEGEGEDGDGEGAEPGAVGGASKEYTVVNQDPAVAFRTLAGRPAPGRQECSVQSSLFHFTEVEHLTHNNSLFCVTCTRRQQPGGLQRVLDLAPYCTATCKGIPEGQSQVLYSLYGIVEHSGTMRSGHYTAYVKARPACPASSNGLPAPAEPARGSWFHASDSSVQPVTESKAQGSQAYLLFYERMSS
ncbi:hypothetical protein CRUP_014568, partial [Coryphaenoides rupestris]